MAMLSKTAANYIADNIQSYLDLVETCVIISNVSQDDYQKAMKRAKKAIKNLREGKLEKVLDPEKVALCRDMIEQEAKNASRESEY